MDAAIAAAINDLAARNGGRLTPEQVLEAARPKRSPLHAYFEANHCWNMAEAARQHGLEVARQLIRSVTVEFRNTSYTVRAPAYVRDPSKAVGQQGYISVGTLRTDVEMAREAVIGALSRASGALDRATAIAGVLGLSRESKDEIEDLRARISVLLEHVEARADAPA